MASPPRGRTTTVALVGTVTGTATHTNPTVEEVARTLAPAGVRTVVKEAARTVIVVAAMATHRG